MCFPHLFPLRAEVRMCFPHLHFPLSLAAVNAHCCFAHSRTPLLATEQAFQLCIRSVQWLEQSLPKKMAGLKAITKIVQLVIYG